MEGQERGLIIFSVAFNQAFQSHVGNAAHHKAVEVPQVNEFFAGGGIIDGLIDNIRNAQNCRESRR